MNYKAGLFFLIQIVFLSNVVNADLTTELDKVTKNIADYTARVRADNNELVRFQTNNTTIDQTNNQEKTSSTGEAVTNLNREIEKLKAIASTEQKKYEAFKTAVAKSQSDVISANAAHTKAVNESVNDPRNIDKSRASLSAEIILNKLIKDQEKKNSSAELAKMNVDDAQNELKKQQSALEKLKQEAIQLEDEAQRTMDFSLSIKGRVSAAENRRRAKEIKNLAENLKTQNFDMKDILMDFENLKKKFNLNEIEEKLIKNAILDRQDNSLFCDKVNKCTANKASQNSNGFAGNPPGGVGSNGGSAFRVEKPTE